MDKVQEISKNINFLQNMQNNPMQTLRELGTVDKFTNELKENTSVIMKKGIGLDSNTASMATDALMNRAKKIIEPSQPSTNVISTLLPKASQRLRVKKTIYSRHSKKKSKKRLDIRKNTRKMRTRRLKSSKKKRLSSLKARRKNTKHLIGM